MISNHLKAKLVELCEAAEDLGIDIDPDGLVEDREYVIASKLKIPNTDQTLTLPNFLDNFTDNIAILPQLNIFDVYNYLTSFSEYEHSAFRDLKSMEGYTMA